MPERTCPRQFVSPIKNVENYASFQEQYKTDIFEKDFPDASHKIFFLINYQPVTKKIKKNLEINTVPTVNKVPGLSQKPHPVVIARFNF
jgi:hypothetical protein